MRSRSTALFLGVKFIEIEFSVFICFKFLNISFFMHSITLTPEEGSGSVELVSGGRNIQVNEVNVYDYVRLYANYRLLKTHEKSLEVFREKKKTVIRRIPFYQHFLQPVH